MIDLLDFAPLLFALGQFSLDVIFINPKSSIYILDFISLGIGFASVILPMGAINKKLFPLDEELVPSLNMTFD
jgi:hypothetical protein